MKIHSLSHRNKPGSNFSRVRRQAEPGIRPAEAATDHSFAVCQGGYMRAPIGCQQSVPPCPDAMSQFEKENFDGARASSFRVT